MQQGNQNNVKAYIHWNGKAYRLSKKKKRGTSVFIDLFIDDKIFCIENPKEPMRSIRITEFSSTTG